MIKNIVFDMGNVLRIYDPWYAINAFVKEKHDGELIYETVFKSAEWLLRDEGRLSGRDALAIWHGRLPERLHGVTQAVFENWHLYMPNLDEMTALVKLLKANGYHLYLLSNASKRFEVFKHSIDAYPYMDGAVVSAFHGVIKPDKRIYRILFDTYGLDPKECFFIDDVEANILGGRALGMDGHVFDGDMDKLMKALGAVNVTV